MNGDAYLITMSKTTHKERGHFIVWDEMDGRPLMKVEHAPIEDEHGTTVGILLMGETKDDIHVDARWMAYDRRNSEVHGYHSFILEVGCLVGRAHEKRQQRAEAERERVENSA